jgi:hypothetical protein
MVDIDRANPAGSDACPSSLTFPSIFGDTTELETHADGIAKTGVIVLAWSRDDEST